MVYSIKYMLPKQLAPVLYIPIYNCIYIIPTDHSNQHG